MILRRGCYVLGLLLLLLGAFPKLSNTLSWSDIGETIEEGWDKFTEGAQAVIDEVLPETIDINLVNDDILSFLSTTFLNSVANTVNSIATGLIGGLRAVDDFFKSSITKSKYGKTISSCIQTVPYLASNLAGEVLAGFSNSSWSKLEKGVKYVLFTLPSNLQTEIASMAEYLTSLLDQSLIPYPLDQLTADDVQDIADCMDEAVLNQLKIWAEDVGTLYVNLGGKLDITPMFNTEPVNEEWKKSGECLAKKAVEILQREVDDPILDTALEEAYKYFENGNDLVIMEAVEFTACTVVCGTVSVGIAASALELKALPFWSAAATIDLSPSVGAAFGSYIGFYRNFTKVAGYENAAETHSIAFDIDLLPGPLDFIPKVSVDLNLKGSGRKVLGFKIKSDIIDLTFGMNGAFSLSYTYTLSWWLYTTTQLQTAWGLLTGDPNARTEAQKAVADAYKEIIQSMGSGAFAAVAKVDTSKLVSQTFLQMQCSSNEEKAGNFSSLDLGYIEIIDVFYGNINNGTACNSSTAFSKVWTSCAYASSCSIQADQNTLGITTCPTSVQSYLSVMYTCRGAVSVWDLKCYGARFMDIVKNEKYQDFRDPILQEPDWEHRENALGKCAAVSSKNGVPGFAMYAHGMCISFDELFEEGEYNKYNSSYDDCDSKGRGGSATWNLYAFQVSDIALEDLGCYNISILNAHLEATEFINLEGTHYLLKDDYTTRSSPINKCAQVAYQQYYPGFALVNGGECVVSMAFKKGTLIDRGVALQNHSDGCAGGRGTSRAYSVYQFPYLNQPSTEESSSGLSDATIAAIATIVVLFGVALIVLSAVCIRKYKDEKTPMKTWREDWCSEKSFTRCRTCTYCKPLTSECSGMNCTDCTNKCQCCNAKQPPIKTVT